VHPEVPNPDYFEDKEVYAYNSLAYVGFELWQVKAGSIFDNIIVTDSVDEAEQFLADTYLKNKVSRLPCPATRLCSALLCCVCLGTDLRPLRCAFTGRREVDVR
jgi:hypothetical protein